MKAKKQKKNSGLAKVIEELLKRDKESFLSKDSEKKESKEEPLEKKVKEKHKNGAWKKIKAKKGRKASEEGAYSKRIGHDYAQQIEYGRKIDYEKLFSYLGSGKDGYSIYAGEARTAVSVSTADVMSEEKIDYVMKRKMWSVVIGGMPDYFDAGTEERYKNWKAFNKTEWWWKLRDLNNTFGAKDFDRAANDFYSI